MRIKKNKKYKNLIVKKLMSMGFYDHTEPKQNGNKRVIKLKEGAKSKYEVEEISVPTYQLRNPLRTELRKIMSQGEEYVKSFLYNKEKK